MKVKELIERLETLPEDMEVTIFSEAINEFISDFDISKVTVKQDYSNFFPIESWEDYPKSVEVIELDSHI